MDKNSDVGEQLNSAMFLFRTTGVVHEILKKQLEFLAIGILDKSIDRLQSMELIFDLDKPDSPRKLIFKVESPAKSIKCPKMLKKFCKFLLGEKFAIRVQVVK